MRNSINATIKVQNIAQKVLLDTELLGQFSDGYWENSRNESWKYLGDVEIANDTENTGVVFEKSVPYNYKGYSVNNKTLLEYVGDRMLAKARVANFLQTSDIDEVDCLLEYACANDISMGREVTEDKLADKIEEWQKDSSEFWNKRAANALSFINEVGFDKFMEAINSDYDMKAMRKDLTAITKILKNARVN